MGTKDSVKRSTCERDRSMSGRGRVALVRCDSYDSQQVERAVSKAIELLGGLEEILSSGEDPLTKASTIVLKPNMLAILASLWGNSKAVPRWNSLTGEWLTASCCVMR